MDAENELCSSDKAQKAFLIACGGAAATTAYGALLFKTGGEVTLFTGGAAAPEAVPAAAVGVVLAAAGGWAVKRYCIDLVAGGIDRVIQNQVHYGAMNQ